MSNYVDISIMSPIRWIKLNVAVPAQYNMQHFDDDLAAKIVPAFYEKKQYAQKWQKNDVIYHQFQATYDPIVIELYKCNGTKVTEWSASTVPTSISTSIFNVYQAESALNTIDEGYYYMILKIGGDNIPKYISECLDIRTVHPLTRLFAYKNSYNRQTIVFETGIEFLFRCEASIEQFQPMSSDVMWIDQSYSNNIVSSKPYRTFQLLIGGQYGIPDWIVDKLNRILGNDSVKIDGKLYSRTAQSRWAPKREELYPWSGWSVEIQETKNKSALRYDEDNPVQSDEIMIAFNFNTAGFGDYDGDAATNLIQIIKTD